jgi:AraC-like DNA-binding protein
LSALNRPDRVRIDTSDKLPSERMDYWRSSMSDQFLPLQVEPDGALLHGSIVGHSVAETRLRQIRGTGHMFARRDQDIRAADPEVLHLMLLDRGRTWVEQDGRSARLTQGDLLFYDSSRPFVFRTDHASQATICLLPKRLLPLPQRVQQKHIAFPVPSNDGVPAAVAAFITMMINHSADADPVQQMALQQAMVSMYMALLSDDHDRRSPTSVHLAISRTFITRNLSNPELCPSDIAVACNLSLSYLHRIFSAEGMTVAGHLREQRLQAAHRDLTSAAVDEPVIRIARRWGIADPSQFSRMFKKRFGLTPGELRRSTRP